MNQFTEHILGYKFQIEFNQLSENKQQELKDWLYDFLYSLYENEEKYYSYGI